MPEKARPLLWIARHGQSAGNVAADQAELEGQELISIADRDADVGLSPLGEAQARALGRWFASQPAEARPTRILMSPYLRARETAVVVAEALGHQPVVSVDERLRERELGVFDRLTRAGWQQRHPEQAELRARLGKFYHRPPGGESWCDVILRLRTLVSEVRAVCETESVLVVTHQVVVLCLRYVLERLDEERILGIDAAGNVANCGVTSYVRDGEAPGVEAFTLRTYNDVSAIENVRIPSTSAPDASVAPR
jgi:probable phosphoglycerate mutase